MSSRRKNVAIESFLVVILMMIFAIAVAVLIVQGSATFQKTLSHREKEENLRIAMSYVNMVIRQNDELGAIEFPEATEGIDAAFSVSHGGTEEGLKTYVYYKDGILYECYTDGPIDPQISTPIVPLTGLKLSFNQQTQTITLFYNHEIDGKDTILQQVISLRSR